MTLMEEALSSGGLATLSDAYTINGQPGDFYECSKSMYYILSASTCIQRLMEILDSVT